MQERAAQLIEFLKEIGKFRTVIRHNWTTNPDRRESDADHTWNLCMMILLLENDVKDKLDVLKSMKIALVHDLVEIYAGDEFHFTKNKELTKVEEEKAAKKLRAKLPQDLGDEVYSLWHEFEEMKTPEAKLVQALDKLDPVLQDLSVQAKTHKEFKLNFETVFNDKIAHLEANKENKLLIEIYKQVLDEFKKMI
jgi:putative hydrolase of HD superfamily